MTSQQPQRNPLVDLGAELSDAQIARYQRHFGLAEVGVAGQRRLANARVLVVGAGGLGAPALQYLAAAGVGTIGVVDDDVVEESNLQRQVVHGVSDLGRPKVDSAADAVARLNPLIQVIPHRTRLNAATAVDLIAGYDLVLDGTDNFATRYVVSDAAELAGKPVVWGAILRFHGQVAVFWAGQGPTYRDLFPEPPAPGTVPSCADAGVLGVLPGVIGSLMATEAIKLITGAGESLLGRLLVYDALAATFRTLQLAPDPARPPVTEIADMEISCELEPAATETVSPTQLEHMLARRDRGELSVAVLDVRADWERDLGMIEGAISVPLDDVLAAGADALPASARGRDLVLYCQGGLRSARALQALRPAFAGREETVRHLDGGYTAWQQRT